MTHFVLTFHVVYQGKSLSIIPAFDDYKWSDSAPDLKKTSKVNKFNFSLAAQLSARWLRSRNMLSDDAFVGDVLHSVDKKFVDAFIRCQFEGRFQRIENQGLTYFLDGAHTKESMEICKEWFMDQIRSNRDAINILVFNVTGDRDSAAILSSLHSMNFNYVCFTTNVSDRQSDNGKCGKDSIFIETLNNDSNDDNFLENFNGILKNTQLDRCILHKDIWNKMSKTKDVKSQLSVCPTIQEALEIIQDIKENNFSIHVNVLVTGSLHLVGSTLGLMNHQAEMKLKASVKEKRLRSN